MRLILSIVYPLPEDFPAVRIIRLLLFTFRTGLPAGVLLAASLSWAQSPPSQGGPLPVHTSSSPAASSLDSAATASPRLVVHLLEYLSSDYRGAVSDTGALLSESEFREQREFGKSVLSWIRELPELRDHPELRVAAEELESMIDHRAPPNRVAGLAGRIRRRVVALTGILEFPAQWPDLARGEALYRRSCESCHGDQGGGNGPAAASLHPKPANFLGKELSKRIFPFRAFNSIRLGVPGTAMAGWPGLSDQDTWDLSFFVTSLHFHGRTSSAQVHASDLRAASTQSDERLLITLTGTERQRREKLVALRLHSGGSGPSSFGNGSDGTGKDSLSIARRDLDEADRAYLVANLARARNLALLAYLDGVEPVEPRLRALGEDFVIRLENRMGALRSAIDARAPVPVFHQALLAAREALSQAENRLAPRMTPDPWLTFVLTAGILLREGFEAVLILIALLAVTRASGSRRATASIHAGWIGALLCGVAAWFLSGWLMILSGAAREKLEGYTSLTAVGILLYVGFWLHRRTEIHRWTEFIEVQVKGLLSGGKLWGLALISFMAVFREAFETVLFLRAITLDGGSQASTAMGFGVLASLATIFLLSWILLKTSTQLPLRKIFTFSSLLMVALAVILTGKGIHSLQEAGVLEFSYLGNKALLGTFRSDFLGIYPTWESMIPQLVVLICAILLWKWNTAPRTRRAPSAG